MTPARPVISVSAYGAPPGEAGWHKVGVRGCDAEDRVEGLDQGPSPSHEGLLHLGNSTQI